MNSMEIARDLTALVEAIMFFLLFETLLHRRARASFWRIFLGVFALTVMIAVVNHYLLYRLGNAVGMVAAAVLISFVFFSGSLSRRLVAAVLCMVIIDVAEIAVLNSLTFLLHSTVDEILTVPAYFLLGVILSKMIGLTACHLIRVKFQHRHYELGKSYWVLFILLFSCSILIVFLLLWLGAEIDNPRYNDYIALGTFSLVICTFISLYLYERLIRQSNAIHLQEQKERQLKNQLKHFDEVILRQKEFSRFKHDINNQFIALSGYLESGDYAGARHYLAQLMQRFHSVAAPLSTGNLALDAILSSKQSLATSKNIAFHADLRVSDALTIDPVDLCVIFGNALDNAIEACDRLPAASDRRIRLTLVQDAHSLYCHLSNTAPPSLDPALPTSKDDPANHGFGLSNIRDTLAKYDVPLQLAQSGDTFTLQFVLFNE